MRGVFEFPRKWGDRMRFTKKELCPRKKHKIDQPQNVQ